MSRVTLYQSNFTVGELDPLVKGRLDIQQYSSGLDRAKNITVLPQGGFERRAGLRYLADLTSHLGSSYTAQIGMRLIPFEFSNTQSFMLVFVKNSATETRMFVYANLTLITNINGSGNDYLAINLGDIDLSKIFFTQSADTLILVQEDLVPVKVVRGANNSSWTATTITLTSPFHAFTLSTSNPNANITPDAVDGTVKVTASSSVFTNSHVNQYINVLNGFGRARIIERESGTVVKTIVEVPFFEASVAITSGNWELETGYEAVFSNTRGFPRTCTFHEGRMFFGGSKSLPNTLFGSKVSDFFNFKSDEGLDDDAIFVTLSSDSLNAINAIRSGRDLQIFTSSGEFFVPQTSLDPITPSNIVIKTATKRGMQEGIKPVSAEAGTLYIQRSGKALRELIFSDQDLNYNSENVSLLSSHLLKSPTKMALRHATSTDDGDLLMITNGQDGSMAVYSILRPQNVVAPSEFITNGRFEDVSVDIEDIYTIVNRNLPTQAQFTITIDPRLSTHNSPFNANIIFMNAGHTIKFFDTTGTEFTLQLEGVDGNAHNSPGPPQGNTYFYRLNSSNNDSEATQLSSTAQQIRNAINQMPGFSATRDTNAPYTITVTRDAVGNNNLTVTNSDTTNFTTTNFDSGVQKFYLETFDDDRTTDASIQYFTGATAPDQPLPTTTTCSSLSHLENFAVDVIRDDLVIVDKQVSSGAITIDQVPTSYVEVGLSYDVEVKTMPAEPRLPTGFVASRKRRIVEATPIMDRTQNLAINSVEVPFSLLPLDAGASSTSFTGRKRVAPILGYSSEAQITFTMTKPLFATVLAVEYKLSTGV